MASVRTRFAPSPTGYLHIGGARTALYNWLFARQNEGVFLLRIEDTDRERSTDAAKQAILDGLSWLGIDHDEDLVLQSDAAAAHVEAAQRLLREGKAYRCFCTKEELEARRKAAQAPGAPVGYDRRCRDRTDEPDLPFTIRFKMPLAGETQVADLIQGDVTFPNTQLEDLVLLRSDSSPTYNLSVVIDDAAMRVTHVLRGDDHLNNTPKQIRLYEALGLEPPQFGHMPLILGTDKKRLSKRHGATSVTAYRDMGYLPEAMVNFLARIGWGMGDREIFSRTDLLEHFRITGIGRSAGVYDPKKLEWVGQEWLKRLEPPELVTRLADFVASSHGREVTASIADPAAFQTLLASPDDILLDFVTELQIRAHTLVEMLEMSRFLAVETVEYTPKAQKKWLQAKNRAALEACRALLDAQTDPIDAEGLEQSLRGAAEKLEIGMGKVAQPLRVALTGTDQAPPINKIVAVLGRARCLQRIDAALAQMGDA